MLNTPLKDFLSTLASASATPGGGSVAALHAAQAAGLLIMVCDLTLNKKKFTDVHGDIQALRDQLDLLLKQFEQSIEQDIQAFNAVMQAYALPKTCDDETTSRQQAIADALLGAASVPQDLANKTLQLYPIASRLIILGNPVVKSDTLVAIQSADAAFFAALTNIMANVHCLRDHALKQGLHAKVLSLQQQHQPLMAEHKAYYQGYLKIT